METIHDFTGEYRVVGDEVNFKVCPVCGDSRWKVSVNSRTGYWNCFIHGGGGRVKVDGIPCKQEPRKRVSWRDWDTVGINYSTGLSHKAVAYLNSRNVFPHGLDVHLNICQVGDYVVFPFYTPGHRFVYWQGRKFKNFDDEQPKCNNLHGVRKPPYVPDYGYLWPQAERFRRIFLVEGPFDAIAVNHAGGIGVAICGKALPDYMVQLLADVADVAHIMLDPDAMPHAIKTAWKLEHVMETRIHQLPGADPSDMEPEELKRFIEGI